MKIAFFSDCFLDLTGGISSSIAAQKAALEARGHTVEIFSTSYPKKPAELKKLAAQNIFPTPSCQLCFRGLTPVSRRPSLVKDWLLVAHPELVDFDIFYVHYEAGLSIAAVLLARELDIPVVQVMHGREDIGETSIIPLGFRTPVAEVFCRAHAHYLSHRQRVRPDRYLADSRAKAKMWELMVAQANAADLVLTPSDHFRQKLLRYGVSSPIEVFPNGLAATNFPKDPPLKFLTSGEPLRLIWHSRLSAEKRILPLLKALTQVEFAYHLDVFGSGPDLVRAISYARSHRLAVTFFGSVPFDEIKTSLEIAHLDLLTSYNFDTFGMTLLEAMAYNTPSLICDPDLAEILPEKSFILTADPSPAAIAEALTDLVEYPEKLTKMSRILAKHRSEILISHRIKKLEKLFRKLAK